MTDEPNIYRDVIECMTSGVAAFRAVRDSSTGDIVDFEWILSNAYAEWASGRSEASLLGKRLLDEIPHFGPSGMFERFCRVVETGNPDEFVLEYPPGMTEGVFQIRMTKVADGVAVAYIAITELFEQRRAYETLANRFEIATRAAGIGVWEYDVETGNGYWDDTTRRLLGIGAVGDVDLETLQEVTHPDDRESAAEVTRAASAAAPGSAEGSFSNRFRVIWGDDSIHHMQSHAQLVLDARGRRLVGVIWDVTDEVEAAQELEIKRREADAANIAKSQFLASMSHEIRTPLNGVLGMATVLDQTDLSDRQREMVSTIRHSGDELLEILNGILDLSRIESGRLEIEETTFELTELLKGAQALFAPQAAEKGLSFRIKAGPGARGSYISDPTRIRQVLYNLLSNALKFTSSGEVVVTANVKPLSDEAGAPCELALAVRDTGVGIPAEKLDRIFQPFTQADGSTTRLFGGTGLGLTIASQLAELLGGSLSVESEEGVGSTFTARFRMEQETPRSADGDARGAAGAGDLEKRRFRALVAEDNAINRDVLIQQLTPFGVEVATAENGRQAIDAWREGVFDIILLDIHMPEMDGVAAAREIRRLEAETGRARTPIVAVTANAMPEQVESYLAAGIDGHVAKPIKLADLASVLASLLAAANANGESPPAAGATGEPNARG